MFINISKSETGSNTGSCGALVNYLEKENRLVENLSESEKWFNGHSGAILPHEVRMAIDANIAKLSRDDGKFYLINISPSQKEIAFLLERFGEPGAKLQLKEFAGKVMDAYARNFHREGIGGQADLLWFAKWEKNRYYGHQDKAVIRGEKLRGEIKEGHQFHIQIIVSRKDITNRIKLSPQNTSRGRNKSHSQKLGQFDRKAFKESGELLFDRMFSYDRGLKETFKFSNGLKNGNLQERRQIDRILQFSKGRDELGADSFRELFAGKSQALDLVANLLSDTSLASEGMERSLQRRRKKRKGKRIDRS
ncbi:DUF5712 family protein [Sphingobacterium endophyticum]|uniref:DUF5712 family protein n=1 Tax=Sphingobacterium endophyticum TaxID=2546448 RepID=UPI0012E12446|nr:DUF5712 family protein [Sphingobacterium endophyticum]